MDGGDAEQDGGDAEQQLPFFNDIEGKKLNRIYFF